jgi:hypothetical protein
MDLWINADLIKKGGLFEGTVQLPLLGRTEIDDLRRVIVELYAQNERRHSVE